MYNNNIYSMFQINASLVNYFDNHADTDQLDLACRKYNTHPPRFVIKVSSEGAVSSSQFKMKFHGANRLLEAEILLQKTDMTLHEPYCKLYSYI